MSNLITIDQLLESVDLDFVPRFVTKDEEGEITIFSHRPSPEGWCAEWREYEGDYKAFGELKLSEFANKHWTKCIYEVPQRAIRKIEKLPTSAPFGCQGDWREKINELVDAVNELKGAKNE